MNVRKLDSIIVMGSLVYAAGCAWRPAATFPIEPYSRVRITQNRFANVNLVPTVVEGTFVTERRDSMVLRVNGAGTEWTEALAAIEWLEVRQRRSKLAKGALIGVTVGGILGAVVGAAAGEDCVRRTRPGCARAGFSREFLALVGGATGAAGGLVMGITIGALIPADERWRVIPMESAPFTVSVQGTHNLGVGVRLGF